MVVTKLVSDSLAALAALATKTKFYLNYINPCATCNAYNKASFE